MLQDTLVLGLLYSEAGQSLLNILGTGVDTVDKLVSLGRYYMYVVLSQKNIVFLIKLFYGFEVWIHEGYWSFFAWIKYYVNYYLATA